MESLFPQVLFLGPTVAPLILRLALGIPFLASAYGHLVLRPSTTPLPAARPLGVAELIVGLMLILGVWVQLAALGVITLTVLARVRNPQSAPWQRILLSSGVAAALFLLGAGGFALLDKPY